MQKSPEVQQMSKRQSRKVDKGEWALEEGAVYDQSLLKAMYKTVWRRWWLGVVLKAMGGKSDARVSSSPCGAISH